MYHIIHPTCVGQKYGNVSMIDGLAKDGLTDVYHNYAMGNAAELCAKECNISRADQDAFAIESYTRSQHAINSGFFANEIVPVAIPQEKVIRFYFQKTKKLSMLSSIKFLNSKAHSLKKALLRQQMLVQ